MAATSDYNGKTPAIDDIYVVAGRVVAYLDSPDDELLLATGENHEHALRVQSSEVCKIGDLLAAAGSPETLTFSYNADGTVDELDWAGGRNLAFTYNADGTVDTMVDSSPSHTKTFSYNPDGSVSAITIS